jgi:hypothetical protein
MWRIIISHPGLGTIGQTVGAVPSAFSLTPSQETNKNFIKTRSQEEKKFK